LVVNFFVHNFTPGNSYIRQQKNIIHPLLAAPGLAEIKFKADLAPLAQLQQFSYYA
jgi:hypothetical protein